MFRFCIGQELLLLHTVSMLQAIFTVGEEDLSVLGASSSSSSRVSAFSLLRTYRVVPFSPGHGVVEWVPHTRPLSKVIETYSADRDWRSRSYTKRTLQDSPASRRFASFLDALAVSAAGRHRQTEKASKGKEDGKQFHTAGEREETGREGIVLPPSIAEIWAEMYRQPAAVVESVFLDCVRLANLPDIPAGSETPTATLKPVCEDEAAGALGEGPSPVEALRVCLNQLASSASETLLLRRRFCESLAAGSAIGYILGVGDRHLENWLLDLSRGEVGHVQARCAQLSRKKLFCSGEVLSRASSLSLCPGEQWGKTKELEMGRDGAEPE